ncbi:MAG: uncharacterized membrane protein, rhomboid family [Candidatus Nanosalina sp. J07AB43]|nr:MAG: uncharacterized membrane protein, rhomboid family [Candidatus Nanosalina sp. J07AB43]
MKGRGLEAIKLCAVLAAVYVLQISTGFQPGFEAGESIWWKFFTSFFGHSDIEHLTNNLFFIGLFGTIYSLVTSSKNFWTTFLISAVGANLTAFIFYPNSVIVGASGGAMGLLSALTVYKPRQTGLALGVPAPMYVVLGIYLLINSAGLTGQSQVAYEAHLFGLLTGAAIGLKLRNNSSTSLDEPQSEESDPSDDGGNQDEDKDLDERIRKWEEKYMLD